MQRWRVTMRGDVNEPCWEAISVSYPVQDPAAGLTDRGRVENEIRMFDRVAAASMQWVDELRSGGT
jgi:hypothetical protein